MASASRFPPKLLRLWDWFMLLAVLHGFGNRCIYMLSARARARDAASLAHAEEFVNATAALALA